MTQKDDDKETKISPASSGWRPVSAQLEALLANEPAAASAKEPAPTSGPEPALAPPPARKSDRVRLLLAGLVGALLASVVFLTIELLRAPRDAAPPPSLVAIPSTPADPNDPRGAPGPPGQPNLLGQLQQQMQQAMRGFGRAGGGAGGPNAFSFRFGGDDADLDVHEEPGAIVVTAKVKDAIAEKFDIQVNGRTFTLRGERRIGGGAMTGTMSFSKSISLPADVDPSKMTSEVKDGALHVRLPRR